MQFFDFLYYRIYKFYAHFKEKGAASTAAGIVGGFQTINIMTIYLAVPAFQRQQFHVSKPAVVVLFLIFHVITYIRYIYKDDHSVSVMEKRWKDLSEKSQRRLLYFLWLYAVISIVVVFAIAIYLGNLNNPDSP